MNFLEEQIIRNGIIKEGNILKVDNFLNHQIDIDVMRQMALEFQRRFKGRNITKILTIEASGIAIATALGLLLNVPVVFAKKSPTVNCTDDRYVAQAFSFTHKQKNNVFVSKPYLCAGERILIVDDFLADGEAAHALISIVRQAGAEVVGLGIAIEKGQQQGGQKLRDEGFQVESIAIIDDMDFKTQSIRFRSQPEQASKPSCKTNLSASWVP